MLKEKQNTKVSAQYLAGKPTLTLSPPPIALLPSLNFKEASLGQG